ncbi:MAG: hypothetical protein ACLQMT_01890 [Candidatus Acidiferrales bacterium]
MTAAKFQSDSHRTLAKACLWPLCIAAVLGVAPRAGRAQQASAAPHGPEKSSRARRESGAEIVRLVYDDGKLSDDARAALIQLIGADAPREQWRKAPAPANDADLPRFIEQNYAVARAENPSSFEALRRLIFAANAPLSRTLPTQGMLAIPPVPSSTHGLQSYALKNPANLAEQSWGGKSPVLPPGVHAFGDGGYARIDLLPPPRGAGGAPCDGPSAWMQTSPFYAAMQARLATFKKNKEAFQYLLDKSNFIPFVVVDWDSGSNLHGEKDVSAARYVFSSLGMDEFTVQLVDLNPKKDSQALEGIFEDFRTGYYCKHEASTCDQNGEDPYTRAAEAWLEAPDRKAAGIGAGDAGTGSIWVNQLVLESVLWKFFKDKRSWVAMPFSANSKALEIEQGEYLADSDSFGVAAADDKYGPQSLRGVPQRAAGVYRNFADVTYGTQSGEILGAYSDAENREPITAMAPGCGFDFGAAAPADRGTALAAAYVAAWSRLRNLLDNTDEYALREFLLQAGSIPPVDAPLDIEGGGPFDPARLIISQEPHVMGADGTVVGLEDGMATIQYKGPDGNFASKQFHYGTGATIVFFNLRGKAMAGIREIDRSGFPLARTQNYELTDASVRVTAGNGAVLTASGVKEVMSKYSEIVF